MQDLCLAQDDGRAYPAAALKSMSGEGAQDRAVQLRRANSRPHNSRFASAASGLTSAKASVSFRRTQTAIGRIYRLDI